MIQYFFGDLFEVEGDFIMEQKNCFHVHGGLSAEMARRFPKAAAADLATEWGDENKLGTYEIVDCGQVSVINAYGQYSVGSAFFEHDTDYDAWEEILENLRDDFRFKDYENAIIKVPAFIGCGIGGGDFLVMWDLFYKYFGDEPTTIRFCVRKQDEQRFADFLDKWYEVNNGH
jgi:O-acetyl-ADP-ribose deacetylase (regulator of RNase III)